VKAAYVRDESEDVLKAEAFVLTGRALLLLKPRLAAYGQYGYQRDVFAGIKNRNAIEGGLLYTLIGAVPHLLIVDGGLGYANEQRVVGEDLSTAFFGTGAVYTLKLSDTSEVSEDAHFAFSLSDGDDWRYSNVASVTARLASIFSLKLSNTVRYLNLPVAGFKNTDMLTAIALVAKF